MGSYPPVPVIDVAGGVTEARDDRFAESDEVPVTGATGGGSLAVSMLANLD